MEGGITVTEQLTEDAKEFGVRKWVYCSQHLRPHLTGWCTVSNIHKVLLDADTIDSAYDECRAKGYKLYWNPNMPL